jgi:hypothetical protein
LGFSNLSRFIEFNKYDILPPSAESSIERVTETYTTIPMTDCLTEPVTSKAVVGMWRVHLTECSHSLCVGHY